MSQNGNATERPPSFWTQIGRLLGGRRRSIIALAFFSILSGLTEAAVLAIVAQVAASLVTGAKHVDVSLGPLAVHSSVGALLGIGCALATLRLLLQVPISLLPARITADVQAHLRRGLFDAFASASWDAQSRDREGHLQEMMTSQVVQATQGAIQATVLITASFTFGVLIVSALVLNVAAALVVLVAALGLFALLRPMSALGHRRARSLSQAQMNYAGGVGESVRVAEETHVFGVAATQSERIGELVENSRNLFFKTQAVGRLVPNVYQSLIFLVIVVGLAALYLAHVGQVASLGAVVLLLVRAGSYGQQLQASYQQMRQSLPFVERLLAAEQAYSASAREHGRTPLQAVERLAFEGVSYAYTPGRPVLRRVDFAVEAGEAIGVIGPSGAGKSTLVQILLQLRPPQSGRYAVNGASADEFAIADWHRQVSYVPQAPRLVHASVADNIRYFRPIALEQVERAAQLARIHDDIVGWERGYETIVGPRADAVSGGQAQRICLARALAGDPAVLVLDEPTSALDPRSEALLQKSLRTLAGEVTLFIVAHRMSTLDVCDRVMVILDGEVEAFDTAPTLRSSSSYYRHAVSLSAVGSAELQ